MKLENILDRLGSLEKNSFIKIIDLILTKKPENIEEIDTLLSTKDKGLKSVDNQNIARVFHLISNEYKDQIYSEFLEISSQLDILIDIIIRDGNCIMKQDWFSRLYENQIIQLEKKIENLNKDYENEKSDLSFSKKRDLKIYKSCLNTAYFNDLLNNREPKISSDELSIIHTLAKELGLSQEEVKLMNYSIIPIQRLEIQELIKSLKNIGVVFFSTKENTIYVADEMVRILRSIRNKQIADKFYRRILKLLKEPIINQISKNYNISRKLTYSEKIEEIIKEGISFTDLLKNEIYKVDSSLTEKKKILNELCEKGLNIKNLKGSTLDDKINNLISYFDNIERDEKVGISIDGFEKLLTDLNSALPDLNKQIKNQFELQEEFALDAHRLLDFNIKPRDILDLLIKEDRTKFIKDNGIKQRGDDILNILEHYKDVENLYLENYENVAFRNLNLLKENGISIKESELGLKFEELTGTIIKGLGLNVDDNFKSSLNTKKDMMDILINLGNKEIIIVECKTSKERGYNKFSSVSRQLKSYQSLALKNDLRIVKILLVAPEFSDDFVTDCEMDTEMNLSLIKASTLTAILEAFKNSKHTVFPHVLFRDIVIDENRIIKALSK
ncbi:hypothetical protein OAQ99_06460 [Candidatus Kapabacteria bacterium]|nr:hypothetical protein [Candidatus Kapabacteria bacterium]